LTGDGLPDFRQQKYPGLSEIAGTQWVGPGDPLAGKVKQEAAFDAKSFRRYISRDKRLVDHLFVSRVTEG
jgi:hypothetical protein